MNLEPGLYRHYKGKYYFVFQVAHHSESREPFVVYQCLYDDFSWWVRPYAMFIETVDIQNKKQLRFEYVRSITLNEAAEFNSENEGSN